MFHDAEREFGVTEPDFCPFRLAEFICKQEGWDLRHVRFYTASRDTTRAELGRSSGRIKGRR